MDPEVQKKCMKGHKYKKPVTKRPADLLEPELEKAREEIKEITTDERDVITYAIYPTTGLKFLKWKYGIEEPPASVKGKTLEEAKHQADMVEKAKKGLLVEAPSKDAPAKTANARQFNVFIDGEYFQVDVDPLGGQPTVTAAAPAAAAPPAPAPAAAPARAAAAPAPGASNGASARPGAVVAPMPGMVIEYRVKHGDTVELGDVLLILDAMKMENEIAADRAGTVSSIAHSNGASVESGDVLLVVE
jgi:pyruvate carboxylase subunit B